MPCREGIKILSTLPDDTAFESMRWLLTLNYSSDNRPFNYSISCQYAGKAPTTTVQLNGTWAITKGTKSDPNAVVYQLNSDQKGASILLVKLDEDLLHLLDRDRQMMIGTPGWSYTLNRFPPTK
jgi:hypothetical protein